MDTKWSGHPLSNSSINVNNMSGNTSSEWQPGLFEYRGPPTAGARVQRGSITNIPKDSNRACRRRHSQYDDIANAGKTHNDGRDSMRCMVRDPRRPNTDSSKPCVWKSSGVWQPCAKT